MSSMLYSMNMGDSNEFRRKKTGWAQKIDLQVNIV